eukprot:CAMPEP_0202869348 /NCGR_PEP_ID=MMETSP1391-20130828/12405_1 /ASSEMBLY_ACC=CAM_ASM_000867 /TAXON_ID=1034604 /ORGANISM="Chlamydomonas leiostraca, Strain SAG 11-49" /LENGTH=347 /DNA_ID=CAMNT_0049549661 /DNA_START=114 /DNA_END=1158 /DNA_ORIENTATION=+
MLKAIYGTPYWAQTCGEDHLTAYKGKSTWYPGCRAAIISQVSAAVAQEQLPHHDDVAIAEFPAPLPGSFTADLSSFSEQHRIRGYEVRPDQRATIVTIANLLQEVAGNHAVGMWGRTDNGFANLPSMKDLIFVMTRLQIRMQQYPKWGDIVTVETYFSEEGRLAARRDWRILDARTGQEYGAATSTWVTINTATRKLSKLPEELKARFMRLAPKPPRHAVPADQTKRKLPEMDEATKFEGPKQVARRSDMDMNGHINNVTYLAWALETVPQDIYDGHKMFEIEVDFKAECKAGELVESVCCALGSDQASNGSGSSNSGDVQYLHTLRRCDEAGCYELVRCRTTFTPQ